MPFAEQSKIYVNFTGGLNTDFTKLQFPENAATDIDNVDIFRTGEIKRRLGAEFESGFVISNNDVLPSTMEQAALSTHEWKSVNGRGDLNFLGVQVGSKMHFHDLGVDPLSQSVRGVIDLEPFARGSGIPGNTLMDSSYGEGVMILTNSNMEPVTVTFDEDLDSFKVEVIVLEIRDFEGVDDGLETQERIQTLTNTHEYNLRNQGWPLDATVNRSRGGSSGVQQGDPVELTFSLTAQAALFGGVKGPDPRKLIRPATPGFYPSNADIIYAAKAEAAKSGNEEVVGSYSPFHLDDAIFGNTPAPKGHFIFSPFDQDRTAVSGIEGLTKTTVAVRPSNTAFYAGRVWYAGVPDTELVGDIFFSQSLTDIENAGKCYQDYDPTAEDLNGLLATDGGVIHIADMGRVYRMVPVGQDLMLVAGNGVWAISGADGGNFLATQFTVRKISDVGTTSADSVLEAESTLLYWNAGGIYQVSSGQINDALTVNRISKDKIQTFYEAISEPARAYARGWYDDFDKKVYWFYNDGPGYDGISFRFKYNRSLVLDLTLGSFYTYTIGELQTGSPFIAAMTQKEAGSEDIITYDVVQGFGSSQDTVVQGGDDVVEDIAFPVFTNTNLKLLTFVIEEDGNYEYTFSEFKDRGFQDWLIWDQFINNVNNLGANFDSFIQAGWDLYGSPIQLKHISHLTSFFNKTETGYTDPGGGLPLIFDDPSGATVQTRWEWSDLDVGRWTTPEAAYRLNRFYIPEDDTDPFDYGFEVIKTKLRMRGKGFAFSIRYESEDQKDFQLLGFAVNMKAGTKL